jgi:broad-specificity NMP kinase
MNNIAICGRMASGKTTLAHYLRDNLGYETLSLAGAVKELGRNIFGMVEKNRPLLQQIGMKMREIRPTVWIDYSVSQAASINESQYAVVIDDARFVNEAKRFKDEGWTLIKMDIGEELQIERLKTTYPDNWEMHVANRNDKSELEVDEVPLEWFDMIIKAEQDDGNYDKVVELIQALCLTLEP